MKVLVICDGIWPPSVQLTGMRIVYELQKYLVKRGVDIHVLTFIENWADPEEWMEWFRNEERNVGIHFHPLYSSLLISLPTQFMWKPFLIPRVFRLNLKYRFDIIHEYTASPISIKKARIYRLFFNGILIYTVTTYVSSFLDSYGLLRDGALIDKVIHVNRDLGRLIGVHCSKKAYLPLGIDFHKFDLKCDIKSLRERLSITSDDQVILYLGPMEEVKGIFTLARAIPIVLEMHRDTIFIIATAPRAGPSILFRDRQNIRLHNRNKNKLLDIIGKHKDHVKFLEGIQNVPLLMYLADVFVYPLNTPYGTLGHPLTLLEAMASEKGIVASDFTGINELISNGYNGLLFERGNSYDLANAISSLLLDESLRRELGKNARRSLQQYDLDVIAEKLIKIYDETLNLKRMNH